MKDDQLVPYTPQALEQTRGFSIQQKKEWGEMLTGWDTKNRYEICAPDGQPMLYAGEVGGSFLARGFLSNKRPFTIEIKDPSGAEVLTVRRPWRWFFARAEIFDNAGRLLGAVQQRFAFFRRRYDILDAQGAVIGELWGPFLRPWTFEIRVDGQPQGTIRKQWSGLLKEAFTQADNFGVEFGDDMDASMRMVCLGATFLIDFVHFEKSN